MKALSEDHVSILLFPQGDLDKAAKDTEPGKVAAYSYHGPPWVDGKIPVIIYRSKRDAYGIDIENARRYEVRESRLNILKAAYNRAMRVRLDKG